MKRRKKNNRQVKTWITKIILTFDFFLIFFFSHLFLSIGNCVITDVGLAVRLSKDKPYARGRTGTSGYWAPEVLTKGVKYSYASDWWSLGVTMYELLTGVGPFSRRNTGYKTRDEGTEKHIIQYNNIPTSTMTQGTGTKIQKQQQKQKESTNSTEADAMIPGEDNQTDNSNTSTTSTTTTTNPIVSLLSSLLNRNVENRLCNLKSLMASDWYIGYDWYGLRRGLIKPTFVPDGSGAINAEDACDITEAGLKKKESFKQLTLDDQDEFLNMFCVASIKHQENIIEVLEMERLGELDHLEPTTNGCCVIT